MGARAFTTTEYLSLSRHFAGDDDTRGHLLLVLGCNTGLRITELLSLTVRDCWTGTEVRAELYVARRRLKGGKGVHRRAVSGRRIPLASHVRDAIAGYLRASGEVRPGDALFRSRQSGTGAMTRWQAHRILRAACAACGIDQCFVSTHSLRKTFAQLCYAKTRCLLTTQRCLAHSSPLTTAVYLAIDQEAVDRTILDLTAPGPAAVIIPFNAEIGSAPLRAEEPLLRCNT